MENWQLNRPHQNSQNNQKSGIKNGQLTKTQIEHYYKQELMRDCQIYGKGFAESKDYFKSKGFSLGRTQFTELKNELKSSKSAKDWFSKEALYLIEEDHMLSVERIRSMESDLVNEYWNTDNVNLKIRIIAQFESLQMTKTKMFSCTPMVQEMLEAHRRQEDMENKAAEPEKTEERT